MSVKVDLSSFGEEGFDVKAWINQAIELPQGQNESLENHISSLAHKLQLVAHEVSNTLEQVNFRFSQKKKKKYHLNECSFRLQIKQYKVCLELFMI